MKSSPPSADKAGGTIANEKSGIKHIAFIMDGNGRWARKRLLPRSAGHKEGLKTIETVLKAAREHGIPYLSFFAFSTENWNRPKSEVDSLMNLLKSRLPEMAKRARADDYALVFTGDMSAFTQDLKDIIFQAKTLTAGGKNGVTNICLNYGGRQEIVNAANRAVAGGKKVTEQEFARLLYTEELPDPDFLVRTGGEKRISNFMLFQLAYTELYFSDKLWPDFDKADFEEALTDFHKRKRRFGKV